MGARTHDYASWYLQPVHRPNEVRTCREHRGSLNHQHIRLSLRSIPENLESPLSLHQSTRYIPSRHSFFFAQRPLSEYLIRSVPLHSFQFLSCSGSVPSKFHFHRNCSHFPVDKPHHISSTKYGQNTPKHRHSLNHQHIPLSLDSDAQNLESSLSPYPSTATMP